MKLLKNEAYTMAIKLEAYLYFKNKDPVDNYCLGIIFAGPLLNTCLLSISSHCRSNSITVHKWWIQFDANRKSLLSFIVNVEEVSTARDVSTDLLV